ncbi:FeoB-associated Cys-rich membrane protein [uncultured Ruminococcus sp.]|uniref:FeoB-associated Cys-rich membrane protein n=1 Tax=uncultured Ruminococcus sp. TaxID=165186 RepID=UPI0025D46F0C|nr:FeoB-associated Cys-rich membrane protein [uncultured Ruminococcus sp.]
MTWLAENIMSVVLLAVLALIVFFIVRSKIRAKKSGGCGCGCSGCSGCSCGAGKEKKQV